MNRWIFIFTLGLIFIYTGISFVSSQVSFPLISTVTPVTDLKFYDYSGITHAHSKMSTGSGSFDELSRAAGKAGCQFLIVTDLNPLTNPPGVEGYHNDVLVLWGGEFSFLGGHLLVYSHSTPAPFRGLGEAQIYFNDVLQNPNPGKNRMLVAAHPFLPRHGWENLKLRGLDGMEILNLDSIWRSELANHKLSLAWSFLLLPFNRDLSYLRIFNEPVRELRAWDENLRTRKFIGWGGSDATANAIPFQDYKSFNFPSYLQSFRLMKNHVLLKSELTGSFKEDKEKIMNALFSGNFYFSLDIIGSPVGFYFIAQQAGQESLPGQTLKHGKHPIKLTVDLGRDIEFPHEIVLLRNGERVAVSNGERLDYSVKELGAYRSVVRVIPTLPIPDGKTWLTWIYSNAIRVE